MVSEDMVYWLALQDKRWIVPAEIVERAYGETRSLEKFWRADHFHLSRLGLDDFHISKFIKYRDVVNLKDYERDLDSILGRNVKVIRYVDQEYPQRLKDLVKSPEGPPLVLFHKGSLLDFRNTVAIVGTRECSHYSHMMTRRLSRVIARRGFTIVSGLARGVDTEAHCGALEVPRGRTIAVLAWMNPIYPPENIPLAQDIERKGAIISEMYFRSPRKSNKLARGKFVERNRITSGISRCIIAIESGPEGGTVHQVRMALSQGREVFALKPKVRNERAKRGFELFMKMGAIPIGSAKPVLAFLKRSKGYAFERDKTLEMYYQHRITRFKEG